MVVTTCACVLVGALLGGCAKTRNARATAESPPATSAPRLLSSSNEISSDAARGRTIFSQNCAACHGPSGIEGGIGPSLKNEKSRKDLQQTTAWIRDPTPPMPKLWPSPLSDKDVEDVAAYVETL